MDTWQPFPSAFTLRKLCPCQPGRSCPQNRRDDGPQKGTKVRLLTLAFWILMEFPLESGSTESTFRTWLEELYPEPLGIDRFIA